MRSEHERIAEVLGAWALDACPEDEAQAVEAHLADCGVCAAEAGRLRDLAAGLAGNEALAPPDRLREAILGRAPDRRQPASVAAYAGQVGELDALLGELDPARWPPTAAPGTTVRELLAHLAAGDGALLVQLGATGDELGTATAAAGPARAPGGSLASVRVAWRAQAELLAGRVAGDPTILRRAVRLAHPGLPPCPLDDALVQRAFETWIHAGDIRRILGRPPPPLDPDPLALMTGLGIRMLVSALTPARPGRVGPGVRLVLEGPGGGALVMPAGSAGTPVAATLTLETVEFCLLLGNRRTPGELLAGASGEIAAAAELLRVAASLGCD